MQVSLLGRSGSLLKATLQANFGSLLGNLQRGVAAEATAGIPGLRVLNLKPLKLPRDRNVFLLGLRVKTLEASLAFGLRVNTLTPEASLRSEHERTQQTEESEHIQPKSLLKLVWRWREPETATDKIKCCFRLRQ